MLSGDPNINDKNMTLWMTAESPTEMKFCSGVL